MPTATAAAVRALHRLRAGAEARDLTVGVRYLDDFVRRGERWLIGQRVVEVDWERTDAVSALRPEDA
jgi:hypothetical protein